MKFALMIIGYLVLCIELFLVFDLGFREIMATTLIYYSWMALPVFIIVNSAYLLKGYDTTLGDFAGSYTSKDEIGILYAIFVLIGVSAYATIGAYTLLGIYLINVGLNILVVKDLRGSL